MSSKQVNTNDPCYAVYDEAGRFLGLFPCSSDSWPEEASYVSEIFPIEDAIKTGGDE